MNMQRNIMYFLRIFVVFLFMLSCIAANAGGDTHARAMLAQHISHYYPDQLTNPQKKTRNTMSQFGYNLSYFSIPLFPITAFINPAAFGIHSYAQPARKENNGCIYTCRGGFVDFSHLRAAADWTVYLTFKLLTDAGDFELPPEAGTLKLSFRHTDELSTEETIALAQKIAFERLTWHEAASWYYHPPYHIRTDQQSAFTPEDTYSNFLGTVIGKKIALRILSGFETRPYAEIATEEIDKAIAALQPVAAKKDSKRAYDVVDRHEQLKLPAGKRNEDVWWDSNILFRDQRYIFKRDVDLGPAIDPWLVPLTTELGCPVEQSPEVYTVPSKTTSGVSFHEYYVFTITPDTAMFYGKKDRLVHRPFSTFTTKNFASVVAIITSEMEAVLLAGFDERDCCDPVHDFRNVRRVGLLSVISGKDK
jgi:hypothetical protein